ncbi:LysM peptidoglycan-binding domain-containing protein [Bacillus sp. HMF5848]|uniref:L,D-transpeptidase family protein n=1 Tax=Bacillus sp. HMF5848 TaxID=2495421 RepID=UPI000F76F8F3|nr:L,D-transpeptidase family protein [Bacillus sp. HMF5848]RSK27177.1 LysM peptidoglycan-binding domain-containing protein [Bacillus sp. HMF5848]
MATTEKPLSRMQTYKKDYKNIVLPNQVLILLILLLFGFVVWYIMADSHKVEGNENIAETINLVTVHAQHKDINKKRPLEEEDEATAVNVSNEIPLKKIASNWIVTPESPTKSQEEMLVSTPVQKEEEEEQPQDTKVVYHTVKKGETLFSISQKYYGVNVSDMIAQYNHLHNPNNDVKEDMTLMLPNSSFVATHEVKKGETLYQITKNYYSKAHMLQYMIEANHISKPETELKIGQQVKVFYQGTVIKHAVKPKETLFSIMNTYYNFTDLLALIEAENQTTPLKAQTLLYIPHPYKITSVGEEKTTTKKDYEIVISLESNVLMLYQDQKLVKKWSVATGKNNATPKGSFQILTKISNPGFTPRNIPGGAKNNPLGTRWLGLNVPGTSGRTYGIHGTINPSSIGDYVTGGCVRLPNEQVEQLFEYIDIGTKVTIK